jgi:hypothetical protein
MANAGGRSFLRTRLEITRKTAQLRTDRSIIASPQVPKPPDLDVTIVPRPMTIPTPTAARIIPHIPFGDILSFRKILPSMATSAGVAIIIQFAFAAPAVLIA